MAHLTYRGSAFSRADQETVLDALTRQGVRVPNSCRAGACQSCLLRAATGTPPPSAQIGLNDALRAQGYFLACQAKPATDLDILPADGILASATVKLLRTEMLSHDVARILLECPQPFAYRPGQFVQLVRHDGLSRSYSLASLGNREHLLELHVRKIAGGIMSNWLHHPETTGQNLEIRGPSGNCFYVPGRPDQPLLLIGTGTGLAPLYAIARDALLYGHTGTIRLYHGALNPAGLYLVQELAALAALHPNFTYTPCVLNNPAQTPDPTLHVGNLEPRILADIPQLAPWRIFLCGDPTLVQTLRKKLFLAGAKMKDIFSDAFVMRPAN